MNTLPNCDNCGKFHVPGNGSAWKMVFSGVPLEPDRKLFRCIKCVEKVGTFAPQVGIKPECSCGVFK